MEMKMGRWKVVWERIRKDLSSYGMALLLLAVLLGAAVLSGRTLCPVARIFGIPCPGCGMTRALGCLLTGNFKEAWQWNPAVYPLAVWTVWFLAERYLFDRCTRVVRAALILVLVFMVGCYLLRRI